MDGCGDSCRKGCMVVETRLAGDSGGLDLVFRCLPLDASILGFAVEGPQSDESLFGGRFNCNRSRSAFKS